MAEDELLETKAKLFGSLLFFTKAFYKLRTGRDFNISHPDGRESHYISISRELVRVFDGKEKRLMINLPPRYGKTELAIHFVAWAMAQYPDSNFLYVSYSKTLATRQTQTIREIITIPEYRRIFGVELEQSSMAKDDFRTIQGGSIYAAGAEGTITGMGAGIKGCSDRFSGCVIIDDIHKPDEVTSDVIRQGVIDWYYNTMQSRLNNGEETPIIFIGQRLHEDDLPANLAKKKEWHSLIIPALDVVGNALHPEMHPKAVLLKMKEEEPYTFAAQYQQDPQPAGGGIFKPEWFLIMDEDPEILATFITADTAETDKDYNDATVFSFWGIYRVKQAGVYTDTYALHWLDCKEIRVEPKDLESEFMSFYGECMRYKVRPSLAAIEKKSTGTTLVSILAKIQGIQVLDIERPGRVQGRSNNKTIRFLETQPFVAKHLITFTINKKHVKMCLEHCKKITANNTHRFDDIADTLADAVKIALIDRTLIHRFVRIEDRSDEIVNMIAGDMKRINQLKRERQW